jgi:glyoxylase-like metal-dependent hydrolase (beta-lactamase superfamily II)
MTGKGAGLRVRGSCGREAADQPLSLHIGKTAMPHRGVCPIRFPASSESLHPLIRRLLAPNPSPFTYKGTQTYIVGTSEVAVIDPGPDDADHVAAILQAVGGRADRGDRLHAHASRPQPRQPRAARGDRRADRGLPAAGAQRRRAALRCGVRCGLCARSRAGSMARPSWDEGWTLEAVATPGHTSNHLCFALPEAGALFTGDHVMGWSTSVVSPPDGDMGAYMASLDKLMRRRGPHLLSRPRRRGGTAAALRSSSGRAPEKPGESDLEAAGRWAADDPRHGRAHVCRPRQPAGRRGRKRSVQAHLLDHAHRAIMVWQDKRSLAGGRPDAGRSLRAAGGADPDRRGRRPCSMSAWAGGCGTCSTGDPSTVARASLQAVRQQNRLTPFAARFVAVVTAEESRFGFSAQQDPDHAGAGPLLDRSGEAARSRSGVGSRRHPAR